MEPGKLQSKGSQRVGNDLATEQHNLFFAYRPVMACNSQGSHVVVVVAKEVKLSSPHERPSKRLKLNEAKWACNYLHMIPYTYSALFTSISFTLFPLEQMKKVIFYRGKKWSPKRLDDFSRTCSRHSGRCGARNSPGQVQFSFHSCPCMFQTSLY